jgi:hypothetical protein
MLVRRFPFGTELAMHVIFECANPAHFRPQCYPDHNNFVEIFKKLYEAFAFFAPCCAQDLVSRVQGLVVWVADVRRV